MQSLVRLAGWGMAASVAMVMAVVIALSSGGRQRLSVVAANIAPTTKAAKAEPPDAAQLARLAATESETRLLTEMVRSLNNDKELLLARLTTVEHNLEDVTGSIRRQAAAPPPPPVATTPEPDPAALQPQAAAPPQPAAQAVPTEVAEPPDTSAEGAAPAPAESPVSIARATSPAGTPEQEPARERQPLVGMDVGGATSFDGLRALWKSLTTSHADEFEGLHPVVSARESSKTRAAELRLVVGPIEDQETAKRICAKLTAGKRHCQPVLFGGGPLALTAPESPSRPRAVSRRKASSNPLFGNR
jgi:hypothetical protein